MFTCRTLPSPDAVSSHHRDGMDQPRPVPPPITPADVIDDHRSPDSLRREQRVYTGVYVPRGTPIMESTRWHALRTVVGDGPVWAGLTAARIHGAPVGSDRDPLEMVGSTSGHHRHRDGVRMRRMALDQHDITATEFGPSLTPLRNAIELAAKGGSPWHVAALDQVLRVGQLSPDDVRRELDDIRFRGMRGRRRARLALEAADPLAESVPESVLRVQLVEAGLPRPTAQVEVVDADGVFIGRLDLAWEEQRVGLEYDGSYHDHPDQYVRDRQRHNGFRSSGWTVFQVDRVSSRRTRDLVKMLRPHLRRD